MCAGTGARCHREWLINSLPELSTEDPIDGAHNGAQNIPPQIRRNGVLLNVVVREDSSISNFLSDKHQSLLVREFLLFKMSAVSDN
jgi:hypothetical protein